MSPPRSVLLVVLLVLATILGLGSYYEASDDNALTWLFSGVTAAAPVASVPLYFHGYGHLLAAAYAAAPAVPWFGLLLGALLLLATGLFFAVLATALRPHLRPGALAAALTAFFLVGWLEHWLWFSYVRVGLLLAGAAVLWAAQRPGRSGPLLLGLAGLGAAWALRPGLAVLSFAAVLPAVLLLAGGLRRAAPLLLSGAGLLAGATAILALTQPPAAAHTRVLDSYLAAVLDYDQLTPVPRTRRDSLGVEATRRWLLGDSTLTNPALYQRAYRFEAADYLGRVLPAKLRQRLPLLARDYFPLWLALAATLLATGRLRGPTRRWFWLVQLAFLGGLLAFIGLLKLPPRTALPRLDFWLLTNLLFLLKARTEAGAGLTLTAWAWPAPWLRRGLAGAAVLALALYGAKTWHRKQVLSAERVSHERALEQVACYRRKQEENVAAHVGHHLPPPPLVLGGAEELGKSLSPFRCAGLGAGPVLLLTGWPSHDAAPHQLLRQLTGQRQQLAGLRTLAQRPFGSTPCWLLSAEVARCLGRELGGPPARSSWRVVPGQELWGPPGLRWYSVLPQPAH